MGKAHTQPDDLDYRICEELRLDARADASKIARTVGAGERTVRNRIDRLVASGAIRPAILFDPQAFGYRVIVGVFVELDPEHEKSALAAFMVMPEISYLAYGQGAGDVLIQARFKDPGDARDFVRRRLPAMPGVRVTGSVLVPSILRNIDGWAPRPEDFGPQSHHELTPAYPHAGD